MHHSTSPARLFNKVANRSLMLMYRLLFLGCLTVIPSPGLAQTAGIQGHVTDPRGNAVPHAEVSLTNAESKRVQQTVTTDEGQFSFSGIDPGKYTLKVVFAGFDAGTRAITVDDSKLLTIDIQLKIAQKQQSVIITADVTEKTVLAPDPAQRVLVRDETLDANTGRPGAPVSIPGMPIETASGGIKAPQYFVPGVAGDHGEPIAQYIQVGSYLLNNIFRQTPMEMDTPTQTSWCLS